MLVTSNPKHAYLIMAHTNFEQLEQLVSLLDDPRNDIYLHIDKKTTGFHAESLKTNHAGIFIVDPIVVTWGGHSQIKCEMLLFQNAASKHYMYYHLLSGLDLPLKTQDEIHSFFQQHFPQNFMQFDKKALETRNFVYRTQSYYFFQNMIGRDYSPRTRIWRMLDRISMRTQAFFHIKRKDIIPLYKGANWVSITDDMVQYVLRSKKTIRRQFYHSVCGDEVFLQSIAMHSPYRNTIVANHYRAIDWQRGIPYTYRRDDVPQLLASDHFFARKFDCTVDAEAIRLIVEHLSNGKN